MKKIFLVLLLSITYATSTCATEYYVATNGKDINDGLSLETPFLTIKQASLLVKPGDIVNVRAGIYREQVNMITNGVTYQPYNGETVTINGTELLLNWTLTTGTTYQTTMDWDVEAKWGTNQVFADGKMIDLVRWPTQTRPDIVVPTNANANDVTASGNFFIIEDTDFNEPNGRWVGAQIWVNLSNRGYDGQGWTATVTATNQAAHTITVDFGEAPRIGNQAWNVGGNTEYFLFNPTLAGVNATGGINAVLKNGQWFKNGNTLYVKTPNGQAPSATQNGVNVIEAKKRHFAFYPFTPKSGYTIKNFELFGCAITTDNNPWNNSATVLETANNIIIEGIKAKYVSHQTDMSGNWQNQHYNWSGIVLRGRNNIIRNCNIQFSATSAVSVSGFGNKVLNNTIAHTNYMCSNSGALNTGFYCKDAEIAYNTIYNTTMMGINFKYSENSDINTPNLYRIHHNTLYDFMRRSGDSGAIDMVGQDGKWIRIDHNVIYSTKPYQFDGMVHGIYFDYGGGPNVDIGHYTADHNIVYNVPAPILLNQMKYVNIFNNVLLSNTNRYPIEGLNPGIENKIINNVMSKTLRPSNLEGAIISNNIFNASGAELNNIFVNASAGDFRLKSTASNAIDKGISVGVYDENVSGLPDLGAIEYVSTLPVSLTSFSGKTTQTGNQLKWTTQSETNNEGFAILRSVNDGLNFNQIGFVPSQSPSGNSSQTFNYTFLDNDVQTKAFYKLQQTDFDGNTTPSNIILLQSDFEVKSNVYPNPFTDEINVSLNVKPNTLLTFSLINANGKTVFNKSQKGQNNVRIAMQNQAAGWYILTVTDVGGKVLISHKVVKK